MRTYQRKDDSNVRVTLRIISELRAAGHDTDRYYYRNDDGTSKTSATEDCDIAIDISTAYYPKNYKAFEAGELPIKHPLLIKLEPNPYQVEVGRSDYKLVRAKFNIPKP